MESNRRNKMKTVNLEEILKSYLTIEAMMANNPDYTFNMVLSAMKEACRQTLELAAENAETEKEILPECGVLKSVGVVDRQSILDTINQIE